MKIALSRSRALIVAAIALLVVALATLFLTGQRAGPGPSVLKVGDQRGGLQAVLRASGQDRDLPYKIEWSTFASAAPLLEALSADAIDVGVAGDTPFAFAYASGADIHVIHAWRPSEKGQAKSVMLISRSDSKIGSLNDLRGKRIATVKGSIWHDYALFQLEKVGLRPSDVTWVYLSNGDAKAALAAGSIDIWSTGGPYAGIAVVESGDRVVADGSDYPEMVGFLAASGPALASKEPLIADLIDRLVKARNWAAAHPADYAAAYAKDTGTPLKAARYSIDALIGGPAIPIDAKLISAQKIKFRRYHDLGLLPAMPNADGGYDQRFNSKIR